MTDQAIELTERERRRLEVLGRLLVGALSSAEAAELLGLSVRQVRRLKAAYARDGAAALVHGNRGRRPARRLPDELRARLVELATTTYAGYDHRRLAELLGEREGIVVTRSTLRRVLLAAGLRSPRQRRPRRFPAGVTAVAFNLTQQRVELLDLRGADYREPFFPPTVERGRRERPLALHAEVDLDTFRRAARLEPGRPPDGLVFHVGRCGSTLLANMLSVPGEHLVIKESTAVNALIASLLVPLDEPRRREREALVELALPFMFRPTRGTERRLLFKLSSWNIRVADRLLHFFPRTPAVFLYRPAIQTVASMLAEPPGWQHLLGRPAAVQARYFPSVVAVRSQAPQSAAAFYAHAWRSAVEAALALPAERVVMLSYEELVGQLEASLRRVLDHFRLEVSAETFAAMLQSQTVYSKDPGGRAAFDPAGAHRRPGLEPALEAEVRSIVGDLPERLAARGS